MLAAMGGASVKYVPNVFYDVAPRMRGLYSPVQVIRMNGTFNKT